MCVLSNWYKWQDYWHRLLKPNVITRKQDQNKDMVWVYLYLDGILGVEPLFGISLCPELKEPGHRKYLWIWWVMETSFSLGTFSSTWRDRNWTLLFPGEDSFTEFEFWRMIYEVTQNYLYWESCKPKMKEGSKTDSKNRMCHVWN